MTFVSKNTPGHRQLAIQQEVLPPEKIEVTIVSLPAEVMDHMFDLFEGDHDQLRTCTLVCQHWRILSQPRLFRRLVLSSQDRESIFGFHSFILQSPHIRSAVQHVEVHFIEAWNSKYAANLVADILEILPRPESLKLYGPSTNRVKWSKLSQHLHNAIRTILKRHSMSNLVIDGWVFDISIPELNNIVFNCPSLKTISLLDVSEGTWIPHDVVLPKPNFSRRILDKLTISNTYNKDPMFIESLCKPDAPVDLSQLKTLNIVDSRNDEAVNLLLATIGPSLQKLELEIGFSTVNELNLFPCNNLRSLSLNFGPYFPEIYNSSIPLICGALDTIPHPNNTLEELSLVMCVTHPRNFDLRHFPLPPAERFNYINWAALGNLLGSHKLGAMTKVSIELLCHGPVLDVQKFASAAAARLGPIKPTVTWKAVQLARPKQLRCDRGSQT
ncbi:hypothetical protein FA15DRAFT_596515 [Coprinopsis marcescibilis]|uniref:Uncharacterized protein n=1 Tax=Coprinopsis marcescibilis TaxID=230819 RepID=A0A5C3KPC6_COPMA|nr:hypothetical protein FA15DRAFT_596515 [Coprinopsis marcescibilis]